MAPWPFFSSATSKTRTPPARVTTPNEARLSTDYFNEQDLTRDQLHASALDIDDLQPPAPPFAGQSRSRPHSRSLSNTIFGSKKKASGSDPPTPSSPTLADAQSDGTIGSPRKQTAKAKADEAELDSGECGTCGCKMQWPRGVAEYRCSSCLMVNDLKIPDRSAAHTRGKDGLARSETSPSPGSRLQVPPIDIDRTKDIINRCVDVFLESFAAECDTVDTNETPLGACSPPKFGQSNISAGASTELQQPLSKSVDDRETSTFKNSGNATPKSPVQKPSSPSTESTVPPLPLGSKVSVHRKPVATSKDINEDNKTPSDLPVRDHRTSHENSQKLASKTIFKSLEEYLIHTFANHECLNCSFVLAAPTGRTANRSGDDTLDRDQSASPTRNQLTEAPLSDLDPKTLLLGDVAENGFWWTGRDSRTRSVGRRSKENTRMYSAQIVDRRSPRINWAEVHSWYRLILRAGDDWRQRRRQLELSGKLKQSSSDSDVHDDMHIDSAFVEARTHVQRTLLKAAEAVLKRPGRPLKHPSDTRFLLIMAANPLLFPTGTTPLTQIIGKEFASSKEGEPSLASRTRSVRHTRSGSTKTAPLGYWEQGFAFGIIKRILGLVSNLPDECHRQMTAWLSKYHESDFRQLQKLVQNFLTYRLSRLQARDKSHGEGTSTGWKSGLFPATDGREALLATRLESFESRTTSKTVTEGGHALPSYCEDWQIRAAARVMLMLFAANKTFHGQRWSGNGEGEDTDPSAISRTNMKQHGQLLSTSEFYNLRTDYIDVAADFAAWESTKHQFSFCQYPFLLSVGTKIRIMELDSQRQMRVSAREATFENLFNNKAVHQYLVLKVRRECLIEDSLSGISEGVAQGFREFKKALKVQFVEEPGVDAGGLKKEWFLLLVREIFDPDHGMFIYDDESLLCYFNPHSFETSDQYFLVGALIGFAIYNFTILDVALPPFVFKRLLAPASSPGPKSALELVHNRYTLKDLAEVRPSLAKGLKQLLEYDGDVESTYCRDFMIEVERYGGTEAIPLVPNGANIPVTNSNRREFVDLYIHYLLEVQVSRQFEPFKRGFNMVCGGNAISLFQPEEIELVIRGSDEPLDVLALKSVATYEGWRRADQAVKNPADEVELIKWFWDFVGKSEPKDQRRLLSFITGSDRIPATGASSLVIKIVFAGLDSSRYPVARTCFNSIYLYKYGTREELESKLWRAVCDSEGFGLR